MQALHGEQPGLRLRTAGLGPPGGGQRFSILAMERSVRPEEARHQEIEQRPELQHVVLDRRAGENEPVLRNQPLCRLRAKDCSLIVRVLWIII